LREEAKKDQVSFAVTQRHGHQRRPCATFVMQFEVSVSKGQETHKEKIGNHATARRKEKSTSIQEGRAHYL